MKYFFSLTIVLFIFSACNQQASAPVETEETVEMTESEDPTFSIDYEKFVLDNGLEVVLHEDHSDPIVAVATLMHVGSNREKPGKTGFAHFFEHMSFNDSENVPVGANRKLIPEWGGSRNGGTWSDGTIYYEVVPKDAFEKILWIDSDRFGYMINTVTEAALEREKQVVKNEKRQRVDNAPYGYTDEVIRKNLYPEDHPYNWTVIGQLPDLQSATIDDVKEFYDKYYGAANASLVIAGDIDIEETKQLVQQWFGEIRRGPEVDQLEPRPVELQQTKSLYFEDNFAKLPELRMVFPTVEEFHPDSYALDLLGDILSGSKNAPLYKQLVEIDEVAPNVSTYQSSNEIAGEFVFRVRANAGTDLDNVEASVMEALQKFEMNGVNEQDLERIKAEGETDLYQGVSTVLNKAFQLVQDNEFAGDPGFISKRAELYNAVSAEDIMRVYNKYIKDRHFVQTSFVPKGEVNLAVDNAKEAEVWIEEVKQDVASEEVSQGEEAVYEKTPSEYDRSEPPFGKLPLFEMPTIHEAELANGMNIYAIENNEVPLVYFSIEVPGGHYYDPMNQSGVSDLLADLLLEGTATKTPAELEQEIGKLGATLYASSGRESFTINGSCLKKNLPQTLTLAKEIIEQPRWDQQEFTRLKQSLQTSLQGREANPRAIASLVFSKLLYGEDHIFSIPGSGTLESVENIKIEDLKRYYKQIPWQEASILVAGDVEPANLENQFTLLNDINGSGFETPQYSYPEEPKENTVYFIDVPGSKQSVIMAGKLALSSTDDDYNNLDFANEILGGGSSGKLTQTLRIEKGYTYGAYSGLYGGKEKSPFYIQSSVRANATLPSLKIIEEMVENYAEDFGEEEVEITKTKVLKSNTRAYESLQAKSRILSNISFYGRDKDYIENDQEELITMDAADYKSIINKYLQEDEMIYVIVGDKESQWDEVAQFGKPIVELDIYGNPVK